MQIIIFLMLAGFLSLIYDLINAPEVDENENPILSFSDTSKKSKQMAVSKRMSIIKHISDVK